MTRTYDEMVRLEGEGRMLVEFRFYLLPYSFRLVYAHRECWVGFITIVIYLANGEYPIIPVANCKRLEAALVCEESIRESGPDISGSLSHRRDHPMFNSTT